MGNIDPKKVLLQVYQRLWQVESLVLECVQLEPPASMERRDLENMEVMLRETKQLVCWLKACLEDESKTAGEA